MNDLVRRLRTACSPESPLGKLCSEAADVLERKPVLYVRPEIFESTYVYPVTERQDVSRMDGWIPGGIPVYRLDQ